MAEQVKQLAARIKELREIKGMSLETLAKEFGIERETYERYESGAADIPVGFLYELANRFDFDLTALLTGRDPRLHTYCLVRKGKGVGIDRRKEYKYQSLAFDFISRKMEPFVVKVDPAPSGGALSFNSHAGQEFDYVLEGSMKLVIDGHELILNEGDSVFFDSGLGHAMVALGGASCRFLAVIA